MKNDCVREIPLSDTNALTEFIVLSRQLLGKYPLFVSEFDSDILRQLTGKSAFTKDVEISLWVASDENQDVARCAAMINPRYQEAKNEKVGFISHFAAPPGCESFVRAMLEQAEGWLRERGIQRIIAPFNCHALLGMGFLTTAYDEEPVMNPGWNPPYYPACFLQSGYAPTYPLLVYTIDLSSPVYQAALERAGTVTSFHVRPLDKKRWESELEIFRRIINENFDKEWEWHPITQDEWLEFFDDMKPLVDPQQMLIAVVHGEPAGVCIGFPNWNPLLRGFHGKTGLWQLLKFLLLGRRYKDAGLVFAAVDPKYRGMGIGPVLEVSVCHRYEQLGLKQVHGYIVNEDNYRSRKVIESIGGVGRVQYYVYDKKIISD